MYLRTVLVIAAVGLGGCSSFDSSSVATPFRERFTGPTYRTRLVNADQRKTYEAAKRALNEIGFRFVRGGPAQGVLTGISGVSSSSDLRSSRQLEVSVKLAERSGGTEVAVLFSEITDEQFGGREGMGTSAPLRDTPLYEVYFRHIEQQVNAPAE
jgi:hypothetical protein